MSFRDLLDHELDIVRGPSAIGPHRDVVHGWAWVAQSPAALWPIQTPLGDYGAGQHPAGHTGAYLPAGVDVRPQDVLVVWAGPETGKRYRVLSRIDPGNRFGRPAHHIELVCEPYRGLLGAYES